MLYSFEKIVAIGLSFLTVIAPKFCCWTSALAAIGTGSSYLAWVYPMQPYLWGFSFLMVGISLFRAYKPFRQSCSSCEGGRISFLQSRTFAWIVTIFVVLLFLLGQLR